MLPGPPPFYFIYGQPAQQVDPHFVHVERVGDRHFLHNGVVEPHSHPHLHQLSLWLDAEGRYFVEGEASPLSNTMLTWMPSGVVHGFDTAANRQTIVVSMSHDFLGGLLESAALPQLDALRHRPLVQSVTAEVAERLKASFDEIEREYSFPSWAQGCVLASHLTLAMVTLARLAETQGRGTVQARPNNSLFARFLSLLDSRFRESLTVSDYAALLATTPYLLNRATQDAAGARASQVIKGRVVQEAKRLLLFTVLDVASVGYAIGIDDPAHFGRFFRSATGASPGRWREEHRATGIPSATT